MKFQVIFASLSILLATSVFAAGATPEQTVEQAISKMKETGSPAAILDFVHWPTAFTNLPAHQRAAMEVNSPAEMRQFYDKVISNPGGVIRERMKKVAGQIPPEQQALIDQQVSQMTQMMEQQMKEVKQRAQASDYSITNVDITGEKAVVTLKTTYQQKSDEHRLQLGKFGNEWLFPAVELVEQSVAPPPVPQ